MTTTAIEELEGEAIEMAQRIRRRLAKVIFEETRRETPPPVVGMAMVLVTLSFCDAVEMPPGDFVEMIMQTDRWRQGE